MKKLSFWVSDETFLRIHQENPGRIAGRVWLERSDNGSKPQFHFEPYQRSTRKKPQPLLYLMHGWLRKTAHRYQLKVSIPDRLGEMRASIAMRNECNEGADFLAGLDQLLNNI